MKTITYDEQAYKLVPVTASTEMLTAFFSQDFTQNGYTEMLAAVPDQLPGVVEHDGEPVARAYSLGDGDFRIDYSFPEERDYELYLHPAPSQLDPFEAVYCVLKGCEPHGLASCDDFKGWKASLSVPSQPDAVRMLTSDVIKWTAKANEYRSRIAELEASQPSAEALVQAALEAAAITGGRVAANRHNYDDGQEIASTIRALDKQQIIEEASNGTR